MPQADPLNNIMGMLRRSNSIDPGAAQTRQARMKVDRRQLGVGASPGVQPNERPPVGMGQMGMGQMGMPQMGMQPEVAGAGQELAQGQDMTMIMVDQMNEIILSGKIQIHRERDAEKRRMLETQLETIRKQILDLGGEPIWADETIEEGLQKLQGMGAVGAPQINEQLYGGYFPPDWEPGIPMSQPTGQPQQGVPIVQQPNALGDVLQSIGMDNVPRRDSGVGVRSYVEQAGGQVYWDEKDPMAAIIQGPMGTQRVAFSENYDSTGYAQESALRAAMTAVGLNEPPKPGAPIRIGDQIISMPSASDYGFGDYNVALDALRAAGIDPKMMPSQQDFEDYRVMLVQQKAMSQRQVVQRELDRFLDSYPNEFAKAQKQVEEWAGKMKADESETLASRGMYYSSMMANAIHDIDDKSLEVIGDIAKEAALREADLRSQLMDIDSLEILETEIARKEASMEYFDQRMNLANMLAEVQYQRDMVALQRFQTELDRYMSVYEAETLRVQNEFDRMLQNNQATALGTWAMNDPFMSQQLRAAGMFDMFQNMPVYQQAAFVDSLVNVITPFRQGEESHKAQIALFTAQTAAEYARANSLSVEKQLSDVRYAHEQEMYAMLDKFYRGELTQEEIDRLVMGGQLQKPPQEVNVLDVLNVMEKIAIISTEPEVYNSVMGQAMIAGAVDTFKVYLKYNPDASGISGVIESILDDLEGNAQPSRGEIYGDIKPKSIVTRWAEATHELYKKTMLEIINDPALSEEVKKQRMEATSYMVFSSNPPSKEMIEEWDKEEREKQRKEKQQQVPVPAQTSTSYREGIDTILDDIIITDRNRQ